MLSKGPINLYEATGYYMDFNVRKIVCLPHDDIKNLFGRIFVYHLFTAGL